MLTVTELIDCMAESGRRMTRRTARNWWSIGILPRPERTGRGRGIGSVSYWRDRKVLLQAQIAHDLLGKRVSLQATAADLWLVGYPVPNDIVRQAFARQVAGHYRRGRGRSRDGLEVGLWQHADRLVKWDARIRGGSQRDREGEALYDLTGGWLELLCGAGDGVPPQKGLGQWIVDTTQELQTQMESLARFGRFDCVAQMPAEETITEAVTWISETASLPRQQEALHNAGAHDWSRARRIVRLAIGHLDRANRAASPDLHTANRVFFTCWAVGWARLLFPILLAAVRIPEQRRAVMKTIFEVAAEIRRGPLSSRNRKFSILRDKGSRRSSR